MVGIAGAAVVASAVVGTWTAASQAMQHKLEPLRDELTAVNKDTTSVRDDVAVAKRNLASVKKDLALVRESQQRIEAVLAQRYGSH